MARNCAAPTLELAVDYTLSFMRRALTLLLLLTALTGAAEEVSPELQVVLTSLRDGERERLTAALGDVTQLPLYRADLTVDAAARTVTGEVALTLNTLPARKELLLRCTPNAAHKGAVSLSDVKVNGAATKLTQPESSLYRVALPANATAPLTLTFKLKGRVPPLPKNDLGMGSKGGDYGAFSATTDTVSLAGLLPMVPIEKNGKPRPAPSGIGDLSSFAPTHFLVSVTAPTPWRAVANGLMLGAVPTGKGETRFAYGVAGAREFPLFLLKEPTVVSTKQRGVEIEAVLLATDAARGEEVTRLASALLDAFDARLSPYPWKTLRIVEQRLVSGAGGMEFPGLVTVSTTMLSGAGNPLAALGLDLGDAASQQLIEALVGPMLEPVMQQTLEFTIAHELAHQYIGMLVGSDPVTEPWADEPLTQHLALLAVEWTRGKGTAAAARDTFLQTAWSFHRASGGKDGVVERPTGAFSSNREYAALLYAKAPMLFDELREKAGTEKWEAVLTRYVAAHRYREVQGDQLFTFLAAELEANGPEVAALRKHWWREQHGVRDPGRSAAPSIQGVDPAMLKQFEQLMKLLGGQ